MLRLELCNEAAKLIFGIWRACRHGFCLTIMPFRGGRESNCQLVRLTIHTLRTRLQIAHGVRFASTIPLQGVFTHGASGVSVSCGSGIS